MRTRELVIIAAVIAVAFFLARPGGGCATPTVSHAVNPALEKSTKARKAPKEKEEEAFTMYEPIHVGVRRNRSLIPVESLFDPEPPQPPRPQIRDVVRTGVLGTKMNDMVPVERITVPPIKQGELRIYPPSEMTRTELAHTRSDGTVTAPGQAPDRDVLSQGLRDPLPDPSYVAPGGREVQATWHGMFTDEGPQPLQPPPGRTCNPRPCPSSGEHLKSEWSNVRALGPEHDRASWGFSRGYDAGEPRSAAYEFEPVRLEPGVAVSTERTLGMPMRDQPTPPTCDRLQVASARGGIAGAEQHQPKASAVSMGAARMDPHGMAGLATMSTRAPLAADEYSMRTRRAPGYREMLSRGCERTATSDDIGSLTVDSADLAESGWYMGRTQPSSIREHLTFTTRRDSAPGQVVGLACAWEQPPTIGTAGM